MIHDFCKRYRCQTVIAGLEKTGFELGITQLSRVHFRDIEWYGASLRDWEYFCESYAVEHPALCDSATTSAADDMQF